MKKKRLKNTKKGKRTKIPLKATGRSVCYQLWNAKQVILNFFQAEVDGIKDPLLLQERERYAEERTILRCEMGSKLSDRDIQQIQLPPLPLVPLGRHGTESTTWVAMPLSYIESPARVASRYDNIKIM